jgi:hypothetical protein
MFRDLLGGIVKAEGLGDGNVHCFNTSDSLSSAHAAFVSLMSARRQHEQR